MRNSISISKVEGREKKKIKVKNLEFMGKKIEMRIRIRNKIKNHIRKLSKEIKCRKKRRNKENES